MQALGIISFEDSTANIEGLGDFRPVPAISFMGRYRIIDFILSNMTNSGIDSVQVYCREKPRNLFDHLGDGSLYNINSKRGSFHIFYGEKIFSSEVYNHDVANYVLNMQYIEQDPFPYVVVAPSYFVYSIDFNEVMKQHIDSKADITVLYTSTNEGKERYLGCDTLEMDRTHTVQSFGKNRGSRKNINVSMEAYIMEKKLFIELVKKAAEVSSLYWFKDILADSVNDLDIKGYGVRGFVGCINSLQEYYRVSMELKDFKTAEQLFRKGWPIYTKTNDSCPTRYAQGSSVSDAVIANGCEIEGTVTGSVIGRDCRIGKGAVVTDSIVLPHSYIGENAKLDHVVVDKYAMVHHVKKLEGTNEKLVYVKRRDRI
jgi:glucose-1-phosphate adenylyltransferase